MIDLSRIQPRHDAIDLRLGQWGRWVRVGPLKGATMPMFRFYRAPRQYEVETPQAELDGNECFATERAVASLPERHRTAIRWAYPFSYVPAHKVRQHLGVTREALAELLDAGRDMLVTKLRKGNL